MTMLKFRRRSVRRYWLIGAVAAALLTLLVSSAVGNLSGSPFDAGDGNLVLNDEAQDWVNAPSRRVAVDIGPGATDDSFGQGTKEDTEVPSVVTGSIPPNKSDLTRFYVGNEKVAGKDFLYLAWERVQEPQGTTNMDFEFNQSNVLSSNGVTPVRTAGDVLIKYDLSQGGTNPTLGLHRWTTTGNPATVCQASNSLPCWGVVQSLAGNFEGAINTVPVEDPVPPNAPRTLSVRTFGEAAINLTDANILPPNSCGGFSGAYLKSRSSDSFTAAIKDFIAPVPVEIRNCGKIIIDKVTDPSGDPASFDFTLTGGPSSLNQSFSLTDAATPHDSGLVQNGSGYNAAETVPAGWDLTSATCNDGSPVTNIDVSVDETVTCTFTNTKRGHIVVDKVTDPSGDATSFAFTLTGGPSSLNQSFSLADATTPHDSGAILPGSGYAAAETTPAGWDLTSATCNDGSPVTNVDVAAGETVTCTFNNRARGQINIHKQDDAGNALQGVVFTLYVDNAPFGGSPPHGAEDTATSNTCTTGANGNCSLTNIVPGKYWVVETTGKPGHSTAPDQSVTVGAGQTLSLTFTDPRNFRIIVLVCNEADNSLYSSDVTVDGAHLNSLGTAANESTLCALTGARYTGKLTGNHPANVNIPTNELP
jgi:Prealbumin-like fold domain